MSDLMPLSGHWLHDRMRMSTMSMCMHALVA